MTALAVLASKAPASNAVVPGVLGFLVVAGMGLILFFLLRSMNKQLRRVSGGARWQPGPGERDGRSRAAGTAGPAAPKAGPPKVSGPQAG